MYETFDHNFFATDFHLKMFCDTFKCTSKVKRVGWPMEYMEHNLDSYKNMTKRNLILYPHRLAPEKQPGIFQDLKDSLSSQYEFVVCQERPLSKIQYHNLLGEAKLIFSANLQETLGISWFEGTLLDVIPMIPNRLSYTEMAIDEFVYPSEWTSSTEQYHKHKKDIIAKINDYMENYKTYIPKIWKQRDALKEKFFSGKQLYREING